MSKQPHPLTRLTARMLPFADAASEGLPMGQLLRLSLFQVSVGMASVMLLGTLNRVMIVVGALWQMGGLALMPFALIVLSGQQTLGPDWAGEVLAALAFLMTGLGLHMTQTAGLALASDRASDETRPRVVALLYVMFLIGMGVSAVIVGFLLRDFSNLRLLQVVQGAAVVTVVLNLIALWKQEKVRPKSKAERAAPRPKFREAWADFAHGGAAGRLLAVVAVGTVAFNMQDVLLEPYGGEILGLSVASTTLLTATWAAGALVGFALAARWLGQGLNPYRMCSRGILVGITAFSLVVAGATLSGVGGGLFSVATLTAAMTMPARGLAGRGLALGAWGASQATAAGVSIALGGALRDGVNSLALSGQLGPALNTPAVGYSMVYHLEIGLLFATLIVLGPLVRTSFLQPQTPHGDGKIGLADFPT